MKQNNQHTPQSRWRGRLTLERMSLRGRLKFAFLLVVVVASPAFAQWDRTVVISPDSFYNAWPQIVVDDSLRLHVFCARGLNGITARPSSLFHLKFDSWGNLLSGPTELWPGNHYHDDSPGVLLDRSGIIHLVWSRHYDWPVIQPPQVIYARLNTSGEFLTPPTVIDTTVFVQNGMNLVQNINGDVWAVGESIMAAFRENGELLVPLQHIFPPESNSEASQAIAAAAPDGSIFAAMRYWSPGDTQSIAVARLDAPERAPIIISPGTSPIEPVQMGVSAFYIDSTRAMHILLGRSDYNRLFYLRLAPGGGLVDTLTIDHGGSGTFFRLIGGDTLVALLRGWNSDYILRCGIRLDGTWAIQPTIIPVQGFVLGTHYHFAWKEGSYWAVGMRFRPNDGHSIVMMHAPGPHEPPNASDDRAPQRTRLSLAVAVWPNPVENELQLELSSIPQTRYMIRLFNILGQQIADKEFASLSSPTIVFPLPENLPAGSYFGEITAGEEVVRFTFVHI